MRNTLRTLANLVPILAFSEIMPHASTAAVVPISLATVGATYTQNFDTLANTGTSSTVPAGWEFAESGTNANTTYTAGTGSGTAGDTYSFGAAASTERALGGLQSGTVIPTIGAAFKNDTGAVIVSLKIEYTGEQWRFGATGRVDRLDFQYSLDPGTSTVAAGTWTDFDPLDFIAPSSPASAGALNGNDAANRTSLSATITGLSILSGSTIWIRWTDFNATGADDGLAVDDFSLTPAARADAVVPEAGTLFTVGGMFGLYGLAACRRRKAA